MTKQQPFLQSDVLPGPSSRRGGKPTVLLYKEESRWTGHGSFIHYDENDDGMGKPFLNGCRIQGSANSDRTLQDGNGRCVALCRGRDLYVPGQELRPGQEASKKTSKAAPNKPLYKWGKIRPAVAGGPFNMSQEIGRAHV